MEIIEIIFIKNMFCKTRMNFGLIQCLRIKRIREGRYRYRLASDEISKVRIFIQFYKYRIF